MSGRAPFTELFPNIENRRVPWRPGPFFVPHGGAATSLDLSLMAGPLDPRVTFTRASSATYFDATGTMQTAASGVARFDCDPVTHAALGLLIEESRTNLLLQSGDMSNASYWTKYGNIAVAPVVTGNQTTAPDGTLTAARVVYPAVSGAGAYSMLYQAVNATAAAYTFSVWLKGSAGGEQLYIGAEGASYYSRARITLTTQWQRFVWTTPALTAASWGFTIGTELRDGAQTSTSGGTVYVWGAQVELGAFSTSYVPTAGATATRAADVASMPVGSWYNAAGTGSTVAEFSINEPQFGNQVLSMLWDGTTNNEVLSYLNATQATSSVVTGGVTTYQQTPGMIATPGTVYKHGLSWSATTGMIYVNGAQLNSSAATGVGPAAPTGLYLGVYGNSAGFFLDGYLRRFRYWPRALSAAELQQATM